MSRPRKIAVTGAAGQIGYQLLFRIASGSMLGPNQPVSLHLLEITPALPALEGVVMELRDAAFPMLHDIVTSDKPEEAFDGVDLALLVGARPRGKGMERKDLLQANAEIFTVQGKALNEKASRDVKVLVVGNPANTNALIAASNAPKLDRSQFSAMTRLDHNRAVSQLAAKTGSHPTLIRHMTIWGNHSATQYPDISQCTVDGGPATELVPDAWYKDEFIPTVQQRGAAIIKARGASSAASAASAAVDAVRNWVDGTPDDDWTSMAIPSAGLYGVKEGVYFSYPVKCKNGKVSVVEGLPLSDFSKERLAATDQELREERSAIEKLLG